MSDQWSNLGILYTIDAKQKIGGVITAQRDGTTTIHSRIVFDLVSREKTEELFAVAFAINTVKIALDLETPNSNVGGRRAVGRNCRPTPEKRASRT